jgi:hypothetical protein
MPLSKQSWTVSCRACDLVIGAVEAGRFVHDPDCTQPLSIGSGMLRCCQCGGRLIGEAQPVEEPEIEEPPAVSILHFARPEVRKRL